MTKIQIDSNALKSAVDVIMSEVDMEHVNKIKIFNDKCLKEGSFTSDELKSFTNYVFACSIPLILELLVEVHLVAENEQTTRN